MTAISNLAAIAVVCSSARDVWAYRDPERGCGHAESLTSATAQPTHPLYQQQRQAARAGRRVLEKRAYAAMSASESDIQSCGSKILLQHALGV